jgi:hypothetical protein
MSKDTVAIVFHGGSYGTYLEWCLTTLINHSQIQEPFNKNGNSHKFKGNHLLDMQGWRGYLSSNTHHKFVRVHPKSSNTENIKDNICEIANNVSHLIYLYPAHENVLLCVNNFFYKIWDSWISRAFSQDINPHKIYDNWPVDPSTLIDQVPNWVMREFLSYYLMPAWFDQFEWKQPLVYPCQNITVITVQKLLFDFVTTMMEIKNVCDLEYQFHPEQLLPMHVKNLQLQKYLDHDRVCTEIVESIKNNTNMSWPTLTLPSEAWIQWALREIGYEIKCHNLDVFPTNSESLRNLLYSTQ